MTPYLGTSIEDFRWSENWIAEKIMPLRWIAFCCMVVLHQFSHRFCTGFVGNLFGSMARRSGRTKRSLVSSTTSPYFSSSKRSKNRDEDDSLESTSFVGTSWVRTDDLPSHLVGNRYFDVNDEKKRNGSKLLLRTNLPKGFSLSQAICSYGYFGLAPNRWVPGKTDDEGYLVRPLTLRTKEMNTTKTVLVAVGQNTKTKSVVLALDFSFMPHQNFCFGELTVQIDRMLRLDTSLEGFHKVYPEAGTRGFGRLYRSPTLFEDMVKTITNCNMKWGGTVEMNAKLCRNVGSYGAFPTPEEICAVGPDFLKEHCRVGYRGKYICALAESIVDGSLDLAKDLGSTPSGGNNHSREDVQKRLLKLSGIGPFAANNILQLMGYFDSYPYDTETVRLWKEDFGASKSATKTEIFAKARAHYSVYAPYEFTAYWYDLWKNYERRAGAKSPQWSIEQFEDERPSGKESDHNSVFANPPSTRSSGSKRKKPKC
mmetsp:Transcript_11316/g.28604  ORF Transcript_11316/g.28604 Transcript_11316/m.28604 type:complete len:483 (-) Transcript_11316:289-1737(-)